MEGSAGVLARGVRIGVDVGTVRVGLASSDPDGILATPVRTLDRDPAREPAVVDQAAAVLILQVALDSERSSGSPAGERVRPGRRKRRTKDTTA